MFIDDDEQVDKEWLQQLYTYAIDQGGNAIIYGRVDRSYPDEAPSYLRHCFKNKQCHPTGSQLNSCATDNVLIPVKIISELNLRFDESRPLAGGTDDLFFRDAVHKGATIFSNAEAIVCETIPLSRASLKWITKRKVRVGISMAPRRRKRFRFALSFLTLTTCRILLRLMACVILFLSGQKMAGITKWLKVCRSFGMICGVMGINYNEYRQIHGE